MEESAQRRERLKAMRMEASQVSAYNDAERSTSSLSNPLIETPATNQVQGGSPTPRRFDYYTDPMSAYSGNMRSSNVSPQISQDYSTPPRTWNREMTHSPAPPHQIYQAQVPYNTTAIVTETPTIWNKSPGSSNYSFPSTNNSGSNKYAVPSTHNTPIYHSFPSPTFNSIQGIGYYHFSSSPKPWSENQFRPASAQNFRPQFGHSANPSPGPNLGLSPRMSPSPGGGGDHWRGRSGGRGGGSRGHVSAEDRPDLFYDKSMVEDPWKFLKPIVWKTTVNSMPDSERSWLPKSLSAKRAKVLESSRDSSSGPSLAEYLAASFNEAARD